MTTDAQASSVVELNNDGPVDSTIENLYYPRLQVNKHGEIVLATVKHGTLTTGILVGYVAGSIERLDIGTKFDDWEVAGLLEDYDGEVTVTIKNRKSREEARK